MNDPSSITQLLELSQRGDRDAAQKLWAEVYDEVRRIAQKAVDREFGANSVQATEIAHEVFLRLTGDDTLSFESRAHLLATVARAIRRLLVDRARARKAQKRNGPREIVDLNDLLDSPDVDSPIMLDLDIALNELESVNERCAKVVDLRFFSGMTLEQVAGTLQISLRSAAGDWAFARAWLRRRMEQSQS